MYQAFVHLNKKSLEKSKGDTMLYVKVKFKGHGSVYNSKDYVYSYDKAPAPAVGSFVVVDSPNNGYQVVKISEVIGKDHPDFEQCKEASKKFVVSRVDDKKYKERIVNEAKRKSLMKEMEKKAKEVNTLNMFELMAASSPEMAELLEEYKSLK